MLSASSPPAGLDAAVLLNRLQIKPLACSSSGADISCKWEQIPLDACDLLSLPHPSAPPSVRLSIGAASSSRTSAHFVPHPHSPSRLVAEVPQWAGAVELF